jgi:hypothetical protein
MNNKSHNTNRHGIFTYTPLVYSTYLGKHEKSLLMYYAHHYNWKSGEASYHSQERICDAIPMSPRSYLSARTNLKKLGWIYVWKEYIPGLDNVVIRVKPMLGRDDPELLAKKGGRPPLVLNKHQKLVEDFKAKHPELSKYPKVQKLAFPVQKQSLRVQKMLQTGQKVLTNYESLRPSIMKLNEI